MGRVQLNLRGDDGSDGTDGADGAAGAPGPAPTLNIGTVTTGAAGSSAAATISGTPPDFALNLTIPRGATGDQGPPGADGADGTSGSTADPTTHGHKIVQDQLHLVEYASAVGGAVALAYPGVYSFMLNQNLTITLPTMTNTSGPTEDGTIVAPNGSVFQNRLRPARVVLILKQDGSTSYQATVAGPRNLSGLFGGVLDNDTHYTPSQPSSLSNHGTSNFQVVVYEQLTMGVWTKTADAAAPQVYAFIPSSGETYPPRGYLASGNSDTTAALTQYKLLPTALRTRIYNAQVSTEWNGVPGSQRNAYNGLNSRTGFTAGRFYFVGDFSSPLYLNNLWHEFSHTLDMSSADEGTLHYLYDKTSVHSGSVTGYSYTNRRVIGTATFAAGTWFLPGSGIQVTTTSSGTMGYERLSHHPTLQAAWLDVRANIVAAGGSLTHYTIQSLAEWFAQACGAWLLQKYLGSSGNTARTAAVIFPNGPSGTGASTNYTFHSIAAFDAFCASMDTITASLWT